MCLALNSKLAYDKVKALISTRPSSWHLVSITMTVISSDHTILQISSTVTASAPLIQTEQTQTHIIHVYELSNNDNIT